MLETDDPIKGQLLHKSAKHREELEGDIRFISERTEKIIINALVIGGALAATYYVFRSLSSSSEKKKSRKRIREVQVVKSVEPEAQEVASVSYQPEQPSMIAQMGTAFVNQATVMLLALAKEKLSDFIDAQTGKKENKDGNS